jgi:hypothetical protein
MGHVTLLQVSHSLPSPFFCLPNISSISYGDFLFCSVPTMIDGHDDKQLSLSYDIFITYRTLVIPT